MLRFCIGSIQLSEAREHIAHLVRPGRGGWPDWASQGPLPVSCAEIMIQPNDGGRPLSGLPCVSLFHRVPSMAEIYDPSLPLPSATGRLARTALTSARRLCFAARSTRCCFRLVWTRAAMLRTLLSPVSCPDNIDVRGEGQPPSDDLSRSRSISGPPMTTTGLSVLPDLASRRNAPGGGAASRGGRHPRSRSTSRLAAP